MLTTLVLVLGAIALVMLICAHYDLRRRHHVTNDWVASLDTHVGELRTEIEELHAELAQVRSVGRA